MFIRKANLAWKQCSVGDRISKTQIACAIQISAPGRILNLPDAKLVFDMGWILKEGKSEGQSAYLSFLDYLTISHIYYYFAEFEVPF
jgi:hypothetical protein